MFVSFLVCRPSNMVVGDSDLSQLSWKHSIKVGAKSPHAVEEVALAKGEARPRVSQVGGRGVVSGEG